MNEMDLVCRWLEKARDDLIVAAYIFDNLYPKQIDIICYHCQQSAEKVLKGFLQHYKTEPPRTHNLIMLCQICAEKCGLFSEIIDYCADLTPYSVTTRYPNEIEISEEEAKNALEKARAVYEFVAARISEAPPV